MATTLSLPLLSVTHEGKGEVHIHEATLRALIASPLPHFSLSFFHKAPLLNDEFQTIASTLGCNFTPLPADHNGILAHLIPLANVHRSGTLILFECRTLDKPTNTPRMDSLLCACAAYLANAGIVLNVAQGMDTTALRWLGTAMAHASVRELPMLCVFAHSADNFYDPAAYWDPRKTIENFLENSNKDGVNEARLKEYVRTCIANRFLFPIPNRERGEVPNLAPLQSGVQFMLYRCLEIEPQPLQYLSLAQFINSVDIGGILEAAERWKNKKQCLELANMAVARFTSELHQIYDGEMFELETSQSFEGISVERFLAMHTDATNHAREWFEENLPFTDSTSRREAVERLNQGFTTSLHLFIHFLYRDNDTWFETLRVLADSVQELNENFQEYSFVVKQAKYAMTVLEGEVHAVHHYAAAVCHDSEMLRAEANELMSDARRVIRELKKSARRSIFTIICCVTSVIAGGIGLIHALSALASANGFAASASALGNVFASTGTILQGFGETKISRHLMAASGLAGALSMATAVSGANLAFSDVAQIMRSAGTVAGALGNTDAARVLTGIGALSDIGQAFTQPASTLLHANNITYVLRSAGTLADVTGNTQLGGMLKAMAGIGEMATNSFELSFSSMAGVTQIAGNIGIATNSDFAEPMMMLANSFANVAGIVDFLKPSLDQIGTESSQLEIEEDVREILETNFSVKEELSEADTEKALDQSEDSMAEEMTTWYVAKVAPINQQRQGSHDPDQPQAPSAPESASNHHHRAPTAQHPSTPFPVHAPPNHSSTPTSHTPSHTPTQNTHTKKEPSRWASWSTTILDLIPIVGSIKSASQAWTGKEWFTDEEVNRGVEVLGLIPYAKVAKMGTKGTKKVGQYAMKKFGWVGKAAAEGSVDVKVVQKVVNVEKQRVTQKYVQKVEERISNVYQQNPAVKDAALASLKKADKDLLLKEGSQGYNNLLEVEKILNNSKGPKFINSKRVLERSAMERGPYHNFPESFTQEVLSTGRKSEAPGYFRMDKKGYSKDSVKYSKEGTLNGVQGEYEVFTRKSEQGGVELIMHKFFKPSK